jgi:uncharacterized protein YqgC (DUF456 family)
MLPIDLRKIFRYHTIMNTIIIMAIIILIIIGLIGSVLPSIPGAPLILLGGAIGKIIIAFTMIGIFFIKIIG